MNILFWVLQALAALVYGASGVMKVFMFDKVMQHVANHSTYHRGQVALMIRQLGAAPVTTDLHVSLVDLLPGEHE